MSASACALGLLAIRQRWRSSGTVAPDPVDIGVRDELAACRAELIETRADLDRLRSIEQQHLAGRMTKAVEDERSRLASSLHNRPLQELAGIGYQLERVSMALSRNDTASANVLVSEASAQLTSQLEALRVLMTDLRSPPLEQGGLAGAVAGLKARFLHDSPGVTMTVDGLDTVMAAEVETVFYRVAQESLNNVARHAGASSVRLTVSSDSSQTEMIVHDDGTGFDLGVLTSDHSTHHQGINAMRARVAMVGGTFAIDSNAQGTTVRCTAPRTVDQSTWDTKEPSQ